MWRSVSIVKCWKEKIRHLPWVGFKVRERVCVHCENTGERNSILSDRYVYAGNLISFFDVGKHQFCFHGNKGDTWLCLPLNFTDVLQI